MKRSIVIIVALVLTALPTLFPGNSFAGSDYAKITDGVGNVLFSSSQISKGEESSVELKTEFTKGEAIWARAYFPEKIGDLKEGEKLFVDLWVDGKHAQRIVDSKPNPNWDQFQVYVHKTGDDDFDGYHLTTLPSGSHKVSIVVGRTEFMKKELKGARTGNDEITITEGDLYRPVYLSKGSITYIAP